VILLQGRGVGAEPGADRGWVFENWVVDAKHCTETHVFFAKPFALGLRCFHSFFKFVLVTHRAASPRQFAEHYVAIVAGHGHKSLRPNRSMSSLSP
jgi:hypothetical protein